MGSIDYEVELTDEERSVQEMVHRFAEEVLRPAGAELDEMPDPGPLVKFPDAIRTRKQAGGHAEASHRVATIYHLANIAFRTGRTLRFDPDKEEFVGDEEANRLIYQPMRAPWHI